MWIVKLALQRPYTFIVHAVLIALFGARAALTTPTDIFPNINLPVVSVIWTYTGMLPRDMSGRVVYFYERTVTTQVNDIEHIESQSLPRYGIVKVFFQPGVNINGALAQTTATTGMPMFGKMSVGVLIAAVTPKMTMSIAMTTKV